MIGQWSLQELAERFDWMLCGDSAAFTGVSTDTRTLAAGELFVALAGPTFDGHDFLGVARERGAAGAVVDRRRDTALAQLVAGDTTRALGVIGRENRHRFNGRLAAITGSAGKTTTKEMLATILAGVGPVYATRGNLNNEIGVPLSLLALEEHHEFAVIEMGAARPGDIHYLVDIAEPDVALVTNARAAHLAGFGSVEAVSAAKGEIYVGLRAGRVAVINVDEPWAAAWHEQADGARVVTFASRAGAVADVVAENIVTRADGNDFVLVANGERAAVSLQVPGRHNVDNALAAAATATALGISPTLIAGRLAAFTGVAQRLQVRTAVTGARLIDDSYNANPASMRAALAVLAANDGRKIAVLGDMAELGTVEVNEHLALGREVAELGIDTLVATGPLSRNTVKAFGKKGIWHGTIDEVIDWCRRETGAGDTVLVKGSRSAGMDRVVSALAGNGRDGGE